MKYCSGEGTIGRGIRHKGPSGIEAFPWDEDHKEPDGGISIDQSGYIRQVIERYGILNSKPLSMPLAPQARLAKAMEASHGNVDLKFYQGIVGSIMYGMLCTHPDLAFPNHVSFGLHGKAGVGG